MTTRPGRVAFVDLARSVAVLFMVQGHTIAVLLRPEYTANIVFGLWLYLRGLTSCLFLTLSGFSFALATDRHWDDYLSLTPRVKKRLRRFGVYLLLGYAMHIPVRPISDITRMTLAQRQAFGAVDILQLVAVSLTALQLLVWLCKTRQRTAWGALGAAAAVVLLTPAAWAMSWSSVLPVFLASYLSAATGSLFPLFPWAAYILFGAAAGMWFVMWRERSGTADASRWFLAAGAAMFVGGLVMRNLPLEPFGPTVFWTTSPNLFLVKGGAVTMLIAAATRISRGWSEVPHMVTVLSSESLTVYFVHLCILYGSIWNAGLNQAIGPRLDFVPTLGWIAFMLGSMSLMAWTWYEFKHRANHLSVLVRATVAVALFWAIA